MDPAVLVERIDWPATGLLLAVILLFCLLLIRLVRRPRGPVPAAPPARDVEAELRELRQSMQEELDALRAELAVLRQEMVGIKAVRGVSPQYGEAMTLAGRGASAQDIAQECGISVAEAELVRALGQKATKD
jgi:hypothetical protein